MICLLWIFTLVVSKFILNELAACTDYGVYDVTITNVGKCVGPKARNCVNVTLRSDGVWLIEDAEVMEDTVPDLAKLSVYSSTASKKNNVLMKNQRVNPCQSIFLKPILFKLFNMTDACLIKKGKYHLDMNVHQIHSSFYGDKFFYGNFTYKSVFCGKKCNISCFMFTLNFMPKLPKSTLKGQ